MYSLKVIDDHFSNRLRPNWASCEFTYLHSRYAFYAVTALCKFLISYFDAFLFKFNFLYSHMIIQSCFA